jgi:hypothetical protein
MAVEVAVGAFRNAKGPMDIEREVASSEFVHHMAHNSFDDAVTTFFASFAFCLFSRRGVDVRC